MRFRFLIENQVLVTVPAPPPFLKNILLRMGNQIENSHKKTSLFQNGWGWFEVLVIFVVVVVVALVPPLRLSLS